jgi:hypothetical protein
VKNDFSLKRDSLCVVPPKVQKSDAMLTFQMEQACHQISGNTSEGASSFRIIVLVTDRSEVKDQGWFQVKIVLIPHLKMAGFACCFQVDLFSWFKSSDTT